jgi:hypothetical protein
MDAVIQVEAQNLRAIVTESIVEISMGHRVIDRVSAWTTVHTDNFTFIRTSIKSNAPNSSLILV